MMARDFCYWLMGYLELNGVGQLNAGPLMGAQVDVVQAHLNLVFLHDKKQDSGSGVDPAVSKKVHDGEDVVTPAWVLPRRPQVAPPGSVTPETVLFPPGGSADESPHAGYYRRAIVHDPNPGNDPYPEDADLLCATFLLPLNLERITP